MLNEVRNWYFAPIEFVFNKFEDTFLYKNNVVRYFFFYPVLFFLVMTYNIFITAFIAALLFPSYEAGDLLISTLIILSIIAVYIVSRSDSDKSYNTPNKRDKTPAEEVGEEVQDCEETHKPQNYEDTDESEENNGEYDEETDEKTEDYKETTQEEKIEGEVIMKNDKLILTDKFLYCEDKGFFRSTSMKIPIENIRSAVSKSLHRNDVLEIVYTEDGEEKNYRFVFTSVMELFTKTYFDKHNIQSEQWAQAIRELKMNKLKGKSKPEGALSILKKRYAKGEISKKEFKEMKKDLE